MDTVIAWIGGALVTVLGFIGANMFYMRADLSSVMAKADSTDERVERIAGVLPNIQARVAWEETNGPISGFVATSFPRKISEEVWGVSVNLYDAKSGELKTYTLTSKEDRKDTLGLLVAGKVTTTNSLASSFAEMEAYSGSEGTVEEIPERLDARTSFILRKVNIKDYSDYLEKISNGEPETKEIGVLANWKEVSKNFDSIPETR